MSRLKDEVRRLGYELAEREIHELFGRVYFEKRRHHAHLLNKLYKHEKKA